MNDETRLIRRRPLPALVVTALLPCLLCALLALLAEAPAWRLGRAPRAERAAALALRDYVIPFQQWGSKGFSLPYLEQGYARAIYLSESAPGSARAEFVASLRELLEQHEQVDIFLLAHTNSYIEWVAEVEPRLRERLRLVYNTGCYNLDQAQAWLDLGADASIAHPGISVSPVFYFYFLRRWTLGQPAGQATAESNRLMRRAFETAEWLTQGLNPLDLYQNSEATCLGDCAIALDGPAPEAAP